MDPRPHRRKDDSNAQVYLSEFYTRLFELIWNTEHIILAIYSALLEVREGIPEAEAPPLGLLFEVGGAFLYANGIPPPYYLQNAAPLIICV